MAVGVASSSYSPAAPLLPLRHRFRKSQHRLRTSPTAVVIAAAAAAACRLYVSTGYIASRTTNPSHRTAPPGDGTSAVAASDANTLPALCSGLRAQHPPRLRPPASGASPTPFGRSWNPGGGQGKRAVATQAAADSRGGTGGAQGTDSSGLQDFTAATSKDSSRPPSAPPPSAAELSDAVVPRGDAVVPRGDAAAAGVTSPAPASESEYVEEYETVYETETEERGAARPVVDVADVRQDVVAAAGSPDIVQAAGVGSTLAEAGTVAAAAAGAGGRLAEGVRKQMGQAPMTALHAASPHLASLPCSSRLLGLGYGNLGGTTVGGWALAAAMLLAIRMSREAADAERLDLQALQARQAEGRQLDAELRARRRAYLEGEQRRLEEEAAKRVAEAKVKQEEEARAAAERQRQQQEEAAREAQRMQEAAEAARRVYEEREARLDEELAARADVERRLREESEARRREEAEARRRAEAEAAQRAAEERAAAAAAEAAQRVAAEAARREAARRLRLASTWYTLAFRGRVKGRPAPPGVTVPPAPSTTIGARVAALLRGPAAARLVLDCQVELSYAARTAPTLELTVPPPGDTDAGFAKGAVVAEAEEAVAVATRRLAAEELAPPPTERLAEGEVAAAGGAATAAMAARPIGSSGQPYESATAAVEGSVDLAGAATASLAALLGSPGWLAALPLQPSPGEALRRALSEEGGKSGPAVVKAAAAAGTAPTTATATAEGAGLGGLVEAELRHWVRLAHLQLLSSARQLACQMAPLLGPGEQLEQEFECRICRQVPPPAAARDTAFAAVLPLAVATSLSYAVTAVAAGQLQAAVTAVDAVIAQEEAAAAFGRDGAANGTALPPLAVAALVYSELMEAAGYQPPSTSSSMIDAAADGGANHHSSDSCGAEARGDVRTSTAPSAQAPAAEEEADCSVSGDARGNLSPSASISATAAAAAAPSALSSSSAWAGSGEVLSQLERLARYQLSERARGAPSDSLAVTAQMLRVVLAPGGGGTGPLSPHPHPVVGILDRLAEVNMSAATRQQMQIRKQRATLEAQAAAVLDEQRGSGGALVVGPGGAADARGSLVPVPERLWASRNVANNLLRFGEPLQVGEAVNMLEEAAALARRHYGARHPCQLAVQLDLLDALTAAATIEAAVAADPAAAVAGAAPSSPGRQPQPTAAARRVLAAEELLQVVQALCERYQSSRDALSCVLLLEAAVAELAPMLRPAGRAAGSGGGARALAAASELASELMYALRPPEARTAITARREGQLPKLLRRLSRDFTEELGAYATGKRNRWVDSWNKGAALPPLRP